MDQKTFKLQIFDSEFFQPPQDGFSTFSTVKEVTGQLQKVKKNINKEVFYRSQPQIADDIGGLNDWSPQIEEIKEQARQRGIGLYAGVVGNIDESEFKSQWKKTALSNFFTALFKTLFGESIWLNPLTIGTLAVFILDISLLTASCGAPTAASILLAIGLVGGMVGVVSFIGLTLWKIRRDFAVSKQEAEERSLLKDHPELSGHYSPWQYCKDLAIRIIDWGKTHRLHLLFLAVFALLFIFALIFTSGYLADKETFKFMESVLQFLGNAITTSLQELTGVPSIEALLSEPMLTASFTSILASILLVLTPLSCSATLLHLTAIGSDLEDAATFNGWTYIDHPPKTVHPLDTLEDNGEKREEQHFEQQSDLSLRYSIT